MTISLPQIVKKALEIRARKEKKTISAIILHALREEEKSISENELLRIIKQGRKDYHEGKTKKLTGLKVLITGKQ